ncbi:MAG TPA: hypothetical protein VEL72_04295, partial [Ktedonobacteraceae bacterium]|nr:hypothetical protein [Ktedonobacteraceae bacterium]
ETRSKSNAIPKKPHIVESTLMMPPAPIVRRPSGSLWAYGNTGSQRALQGQFKAPLLSKSKKRQPGRPGESEGRYPSSSLWSYSDKLPTVKKGR